MKDIFRPRNDPARAIYDAFQKEALKRKDYSFADRKWIESERRVVFETACREAERLGMKKPTMEQIKRAEESAYGHIDYGAKWAYKITDIMRLS